MSDETQNIKCFTCEAPFADYIAMVPHKDGGGKIAFSAPLCRAHMEMAMVAGWLPIHELKSDEGQRAWNEHGFGNRNKSLPTQEASK